MRKSLMMFFVVFSSGCITPSTHRHDVIYQPDFKIQNVDGDLLVCQTPQEIEQLYKKLRQCKDGR